ncbi:SGNH/GDSL hydrolase family protein [Pseudomonas sp. BN411]|uniref:SGNH/GDSL hydrolase family protein n=1 Tax=Pseudomonas sp. BN411 TaxID=2567887 RepID=UPI00245483BD|nr:SGNH/GDSL hydrolase family protein [Pseudomonas sp. BN411]MDH4564618.1 hypothetical protein [Pseudomonas sp. BN411]
MQIDTVVVFGDSLSDIGKKWVTKSGRMARATGQMSVSPSGRFSDCRNWTDFMFEEATQRTMIANTAQTTIELSNRHTTLSNKSMLNAQSLGLNNGQGFNNFQYANYAEGGACGDTPVRLGNFLGTFDDQIKAFKTDCNSNNITLGNTLFIVWFGANDLYTADRDPAGMATAADKVANIQRNVLRDFVALKNGRSKFIFINLARPLSSVRYALRLKQAEQKLLNAAMPKDVIEMVVNPQRFKGGIWHAQAAMQTALDQKSSNQQLKEFIELKKAVAEIKSLELGVINYNLALALHTRRNGDGLVEIGSCLSEETIRQLVKGNYRLKEGAATADAAHVSSASYTASNAIAHLATIDQAHPTDQVYKLIWLEVYEEIKKSNCTFGNISDQLATPTLSTLSGPSSQTRANFNSVMQELRNSFV